MDKTYIIAEMAWGHDGSKEQAIEIVKKAKESGADGISIHITDLPSYMVPYYGNGKGKVSGGREALDVYKYLEEINLTSQDWKDICSVVAQQGLDLIIMPNDDRSLILSEELLNPDYYVISAASFVEENFLRNVACLQKKTFFRIGGAYLGEIERAINIFKEENNNKIVLLHGFQNYPTELNESNLAFLTSLNKVFGVEVGLADHIDGNDEFAKVIPALALAYGATYVEKHITLDRNDKSEDFESALNPNDFRKMVENIRNAEVAIGSDNISKLSDATLRYRNISRKRVVAVRDLKIGEVLTNDDLCFKRSDIGISPDKVETILGRRITKSVNKDDSLTIDIFE
ncbi:MAG: N-acetylneuraminate synthase family protein [Bacteroidales bacterium]|nr:N-acetylneuraminate synthase family protein [Bacteroidales bacterium]